LYLFIIPIMLYLNLTNNCYQYSQYFVGGKIQKNDIGGACGAYGGGQRCAQGVGGEAGGKEAIGETQT
jgi:hypothetical protein